MLIFASLVKICHAQVSDRKISTEATIFTVIAGLMCLIFWCCFVFMCFSKQKCVTTSRTPSTQTLNDSASSSPQAHTTRQTRQIHHTQTDSPQSIMLHRQQMAIACYHTSKPETVFISEGYLHQCDAPPSYEEAVRIPIQYDNNTT